MFHILWRQLTKFRKEERLWEYETGLLFRFGRFKKALEPGRTILWGRGYEVLRFDTRWTELLVQGQEVLTHDKATVKLTAVGVYRIKEARLYHQAAADGLQTLYTQVQLALRDLAAAETLEDLLQKKADLAETLLAQCAPAAEALGLELQALAVRDLILGGDLKSAFNQVLSARQSAIAELEKARGEAASLRTLSNAAKVFDKNPQVLHLRYLQTLEQLGSGYGSPTLVLGKPEDWMTGPKSE
ncbi:MAG: slipin family protein [Verrucomicrobiota bacterium]